jgi:TonB-linked SusC/RagA family outer membrane protein
MCTKFHSYAQSFIAYFLIYPFLYDVKLFQKNHLKSKLMKSFIRKHAWIRAGYAACLFLLFASWGSSQVVTVTGTVNDQTGEPLPGVNIRLEGTNSGTITDADGAYTINVEGAQSVLQFNYIGYAPQSVTVGNRSVIHIVMEEDLAELEEVVVIGYGTVRKSDVTGAVFRVTDKTIRERPVQDAVQALQGKATGVDITSNSRPGEVGTIRIRGNRSIDASNEPLYVIDGIPMISTNITDINPNDIASIEILKDASATAIYGSRGANGVVLVSTKKGVKGKTSIDYDGTITFSRIHSLTEWMDAGELLDWQRQRYLNGGTYAGLYGTAPDPARDFTLFMESLNYMKPILGTAYRLDDNDPARPVLRQATPDEIARGYADQVPIYDAANLFDQKWADLVLRTGIVHNHQVSLSSGTDNSNLYMSAGYLNQESPMKDQDYNRYNFKLNGEITPRKWLTVGLMANGTYGLQNRGLENGNVNSGSKDSYGQARSLLPYAPAYDEAGLVFRPTAVDGISYDNILNNMENAHYEVRQYSIMANTFTEIRFVPWLRYRMNFGSQYRNNRTGYYYGPNFSNPFGSRPIASAPGTGRNHTRSYFSWVVENLLYADKTWGAHTIGATLLQSAQRVHDEEIHMRALNIIFPSSLWYSLQQNATSTPYDYGTSMTETQLMSYMARLNYSLSNKYLLTVTGRWDGASVLAEGHKWDFFPSAALAWKMEEEEWIRNIDAINQLKLRAGYGVTGNAAVQAYATTGGIRQANYYFDKTVAAGQKSNVMPNFLLGWEKTAQWNIGLDYMLLKGRLSGSIELYQAKTSDLLLNRTLPAITGYTQVRANIGKTQNKGIEITVSSINVDLPDFRWTTDVNWSLNREKITELALGMEEDITNGWFVGQPIAVWYDYKYDRLWQDTPEDQRLMAIYKATSNYNYQPGQTKVVDQPLHIDSSKKGENGWKTVTVNGEEITYEDNGFGVLADATDRYILGTSRPKWVGGLTNTLTYKNWELNAFLYVRAGNMYYGALQTFGRRVETSVWSPENPNAKFYQPTSTSGLTDHSAARNYTDGTIVALRNISLAYTFSPALLGKRNISRAQVYAQVLNPFLWGGEAVQLGINTDDLSGWRQRTQTAITDTGGGQTNNTMMVRSFVIGLRLGF